MSQLLASLQSNPDVAGRIWNATGNTGAMPPGFLSQLSNYGGSNYGGGPGNTPAGATSFGSTNGSSLTPNPYANREAA